MDNLVLKYLAWTASAYGAHLFFALMQILLCAYLIVSGIFNLSSIKREHPLLKRLGLVFPAITEKKPALGCMQIVLGAALLLPVITGATFLFPLTASLLAFIIIIYIGRNLADKGKASGRLARSVIAFAAILVFGLTLWEGADMIAVTKTIAVKAKYWRTKEKAEQKMLEPDAPKKGQVAPDFELTDTSGSKTVRLSDFRGKKPVVLVFGSYT